MPMRMVWDRGQGFGQLRFGCREGRHGIGRKGQCTLDRVRRRRTNQRVDIVRVGGKRAIEKALRSRHIVWGRTLIEPSQTLKIEVHRVGGWSLFRASRLSGDELGVERIGKSGDDLVLHLEKIGHRLFEPLGPEMISGYCVDELYVDAHA